MSMYSRTNFDKVKIFMDAFGQKTLKKPTLPSDELAELRRDFIAEETGELYSALAEKNIVQIADALTDILYVVYGAGHAFGIDLDDCFREVHESNMSKLGEDGKPVYRDDGKVLKGPNFFEPKLGELIRRKIDAYN